ncbi:MAG: carboxylesterase family protein [Lachnospiraceae bacterium]|nr:carboxylesterase family protein [Lachnospiraceae bacterium]
MKTDIINTPCGRIQGVIENNTEVYKGVPFATAERFSYPKEVTSFDGLLSADSFAPASIQESAYIPGDPEAFYNKEFYNGEHVSYSEDSLYLNIWTPDHGEDKKYPVLVYVHGGGFDHGYSYEKPFDGFEYAKRGVILVTITYRLSVFGYIALPELADSEGHFGNYGLFDIITALKWINRNISAFGGDPSNITVSGQSAGAMSVESLCVSPLTESLFSKAIMLSGGGVSPHSHFSSSLEDQVLLGKRFCEYMKVQNGTELKELPAKDLMLGFLDFSRSLSEDIRFCIPTVDGYLLPKSPFEMANEGNMKNIPYILGTTSEDILPELFHPMAKEYALLAERFSHKPVYLYYFSRQLPGDDAGAWHSSDLWYFFGTLKKCWRPFEERDYMLSARYMDHVAEFVKNSSPGADWPAFTEKDKFIFSLN